MRFFEKKQSDWSKKRLFRGGFTLVELSLSMAFIGVLSIIIVFVINGAVSSYRRGITLNLVNTVGTEVTEEIKTTVHKAPMIMSFESLCRGVYGDGNSKDKCLNYNGAGLIAVSQKGDIYKGDGEVFKDVPVYGAVCLGNYSYIWNSGYFFNSDYEVKTQDGNGTLGKLSFEVKKDNSPGNSSMEDKWFGRLLRIKDEKRAVCRNLISPPGDVLTPFSYFGNEPSSETESSDINDSILFEPDSNGFDIGEDVAEILTNESKVAVYGFDVETPAIGDGTLYNLSITLGTVDSGININDENCKVSGGANDLDFCAINKFNITALASGGRKND
jgi:hypothetical protein